MTDAERKQLSEEFDAEMWDTLDKESALRKSDKRFRRWPIPSRFIQMLGTYRGETTAHKLLESNDPPPMFAYLRTIDRLDLCMEYYVSRVPKYRELFSIREFETAEARLKGGL